MDIVYIFKNKFKVNRFSFITVLALILLTVGCTWALLRDSTPDTFKVGILMHLTGPDSLESDELLDWMADRINDSGGIGGTPIELVYKDAGKEDVNFLAKELINHPKIDIVIGPQQSEELHEIAPLFIENQKLLISPSATAGDITRAYGDEDFIWRTVQSDIAQVRSILYELAAREVKEISLIHTRDSYGETFLNWTGFFCTELGIDLLNIVDYHESSNLNNVMDEALEGEPEYVLTVAYPETGVEFKNLLKARDEKSKLFFADAVEAPYFIDTLGPTSKGTELIAPAADPESGFEEEYYSHFGYYPWDYASTTCDAMLLAAYTLARQQSQEGIGSILSGEPLEESFKQVIKGRGDKYSWDDYDNGITAILEGDLPDFQGASGPLYYDEALGVDPVKTYYSLNRIETKDRVFDFHTIRRFSSDESAGIGILEAGSSAAYTRASLEHRELSEQNLTGRRFLSQHTRENLQAVIVSASEGWEDYRHQANTLAMYKFLRDNGVKDENIILFSVDDIPWLEENPEQGTIRHEVGGPNLRKEATIDYTGDSVTVENLEKVLLGQKTLSTPVVLESDKNTNLLFYFSGHGMPRALNFMGREKWEKPELIRLLEKMEEKEKFRQKLMIVDACYGESMALEMEIPRVLYITSASRVEKSFGSRYDPEIQQWLADEFTSELLRTMGEPGITLKDLYLSVYQRVPGSHVRLANYKNFGDIQTPVREFIEP